MIETTVYSPNHLIMAPLIIPLITAAFMLLYNDKRRRTKLGFGGASILLQMIVAVELLNQAKQLTPDGAPLVGTYLLGDWAVPYGIVLVVDHLSALMLLLSALVALPALIYSGAGWHGKGQHFHSLFQLLLFGVNGAFLTGDLFNLFVFFEILLAASYGLMLHGSGADRIKAGLQYIAINLVASLLFLVGAALVYGVTGTLNMADIGASIAGLTDNERRLFHAAAALLALVFLVKAATWPLCFWLPRTYGTASPPSAAAFAILTKVGAYVVLRTSLLAFGPMGGVSATSGGAVLLLGGCATITYGMIGILSAGSLPRAAGFATLISSGTMISVTGFSLLAGNPVMLGGALYYMLGSTLAVSALFLLAEPIERTPAEDEPEEPTDPYSVWRPMGLGTVEEETTPAITLPASQAAMGACFIMLVIQLAGLPPLNGFVGKFAMLSGLLAENASATGTMPGLAWAFMLLLILSGFGTMIALVRFGIRRFWVTETEDTQILALEIGPVSLLLVGIVALTLWADPVMRYTLDTAEALLQPSHYIEAVLGAPRVSDNPPQATARGMIP